MYSQRFAALCFDLVGSHVPEPRFPLYSCGLPKTRFHGIAVEFIAFLRAWG